MGKISVLYVKSREIPQIIEIDDSLESMQKLVGGYIEIYPLPEDNSVIVCDEEGKLNGKPLNRAIYNDDGEIVEIIAGDFFVACALPEEENLTTLPDSLMGKYSILFHQPEVFFRTENGTIRAAPLLLQKETNTRGNRTHT